MGFRMWKKGKTNDYTFFDRTIAEQYNIGGVDMWLYTYEGPAGNNGSTDSTLPDYSTTEGGVSSIGDLVLGETTQRNYNLNAITLQAVYQVQEATPDLKIPGLFFNYNTMDITVHYNTMMQRIGRKIIPGDVLELPNLRDTDVLGRDEGINRFYVVQDSFRTSEGYSATWQHHIFKLRVKPLTDSPEFGNLMGDNSFSGADINDPTPSTDPNSNPNSSYDMEMDIMNKIIFQGDNEMPYIHWTNEHIYDDKSNKEYLLKDIISDFKFPDKPSDEMFFIKEYYPELFSFDGNEWSKEESTALYELPKTGRDGEFVFVQNYTTQFWVLWQYSSEKKKWLECVLPFVPFGTDIPNDTDFYSTCQAKELFQYKNKNWEKVITDSSTYPFTTKDMDGVRTNINNKREAIPPARGTVGEGKQFPENPQDGEYFYRTDYKPVTLWKYSSTNQVWSQFKYGGRLPWTGANIEQTDFVNSSDRVPLKDILKPNTLYRKGDE